MALMKRQVEAAVETLESAAKMLQKLPELVPAARWMLAPLLGISNGSTRHTRSQVSTRSHVAEDKPKRRISAARRKQLSLAAKKRWAVAKRAGKNTIGGK